MKNKKTFSNDKTKSSQHYMLHNFPPFVAQKLREEAPGLKKQSIAQRLFTGLKKIFSLNLFLK